MTGQAIYLLILWMTGGQLEDMHAWAAEPEAFATEVECLQALTYYRQHTNMTMIYPYRLGGECRTVVVK